MPPLWIADNTRELASRIGLGSVADGWRDDLHGEIINDRGDRQVLRIDVPDLRRTVYLKRWRFPPSSAHLWLPGSDALRRRAKTEFENLRKLARLGFTVPEPLLFGEVFGLWGPVASLLLLEGLNDYTCSADWIKDHPEDRGRIASGIAVILATLHNKGLFYRSPGLKHFYVHNDPSVDALALIDVPRLDRKPVGLSGWFGRLFGADIPCQERDLSKVLLTLRQELEADEEVLDAFWKTYLGQIEPTLKDEGLVARAEAMAESRGAARDAKASA
jgi:hypothetical protein